MKAKGIVFLIIAISSYYVIATGLAGIGISYYIPTLNYETGTKLQTDAIAFGLIALGFIMFAVSYMELENHYNFSIKIMNKHHCEKVMVIYVGMIIAIVYIFYLMFTGKYTYPIEWFYLAGMTWLGSLLGIVYYKITNRKPVNPKTVILFWKDK